VLCPLSQDEWFGQVIEIPFSGLDVANSPKPLERAAIRRRRKNCHAASPVRDFDGFALSNPPKKLAGALPKFSDAHR
jgi:hypothetical protein